MAFSISKKDLEAKINLASFDPEMKYFAKNWDSDGALQLSEVTDAFFAEARVSQMIYFAQTLGCNSFTGNYERYTREALGACLTAKEEVKLGAPFTNKIGSSELNELLATADKTKPIFLLVWSRNCYWCMKLKPEIVDFAGKNPGKATYVGMEYPYAHGDEEIAAVQYLEPNRLLLDHYGITSYPSVVMLRNINGAWSADKPIHPNEAIEVMKP